MTNTDNAILTESEPDLTSLERAVVTTSLAALAAETRLGLSCVIPGPATSMAEIERVERARQAERTAAAVAYKEASQAWRRAVAALAEYALAAEL